ncbi:hypothetical protein ACFXAE_29215 [Streptomyces sp. NPDC059454]
MLAAGLLTVVALGALRLDHGMADVRGESTAPAYRPGAEFSTELWPAHF